MLEKRIRAEYGSHWETYADYLVTQIQSGVYLKAKNKWASTHSITSLNAIGHSNAVIEWANDSDALDCSIVWPGYDADPEQDFAGEYYQKAVPVIDLQLAKGMLFENASFNAQVGIVLDFGLIKCFRAVPIKHRFFG